MPVHRNESCGPNGREWDVVVGDVVATTAGHSVVTLGRRRPPGFDYWLLVGGGHRLWFPDEQTLQSFVADTLAVEDGDLAGRLEAIFVGMHWAHSCAYRFDVRDGECRPLPPSLDVTEQDARSRLLPTCDDGDAALARKAKTVVRAAEAAWRELRELPLAERPFPVLQ